MLLRHLYGYVFHAAAESDAGGFGDGLDVDTSTETESSSKPLTLEQELAAAIKGDTPPDVGSQTDELDADTDDDAGEVETVDFAEWLREQGVTAEGDDPFQQASYLVGQAKEAAALREQMAALQAQQQVAQQQLPQNFPQTQGQTFYPGVANPNQPANLQQLPPAVREYVEKVQFYDQLSQAISSAPKRLDYSKYVRTEADGTVVPVDPNDVDAIHDAHAAARWMQTTAPQVLSNLPGLIEHILTRKMIDGTGVIPGLFREIASQSVAPHLQPIQQQITQREAEMQHARKLDELWESVAPQATTDGQINAYGQALIDEFKHAQGPLKIADPELAFAHAKRVADRYAAPAAGTPAAPAVSRKSPGKALALKVATKTSGKGAATRATDPSTTKKQRVRAGSAHAIERDILRHLNTST